MTAFVEGQVVEEDIEFTLVELCRASGASEEELTLWIAEGAVEQQRTTPREWRFSGRRCAACEPPDDARRILRSTRLALRSPLTCSTKSTHCGRVPGARAVVERVFHVVIDSMAR